MAKETRTTLPCGRRVRPYHVSTVAPQNRTCHQAKVAQAHQSRQKPSKPKNTRSKKSKAPFPKEFVGQEGGGKHDIAKRIYKKFLAWVETYTAQYPALTLLTKSGDAMLSTYMSQTADARMDHDLLPIPSSTWDDFLECLDFYCDSFNHWKHADGSPCLSNYGIHSQRKPTREQPAVNAIMDELRRLEEEERNRVSDLRWRINLSNQRLEMLRRNGVDESYIKEEDGATKDDVTVRPQVSTGAQESNAHNFDTSSLDQRRHQQVKKLQQQDSYQERVQRAMKRELTNRLQKSRIEMDAESTIAHPVEYFDADMQFEDYDYMYWPDEFGGEQEYQEIQSSQTYEHHQQHYHPPGFRITQARHEEGSEDLVRSQHLGRAVSKPHGKNGQSSRRKKHQLSQRRYQRHQRNKYHHNRQSNSHSLQRHRHRSQHVHQHQKGHSGDEPSESDQVDLNWLHNQYFDLFHISPSPGPHHRLDYVSYGRPWPSWNILLPCSLFL